MSAQKLVIMQIPSEARPEHVINARLDDENEQGWRVAQMMDHNGLLVLLMERDAEPTADVIGVWNEYLSAREKPTPPEPSDT